MRMSAVLMVSLMLAGCGEGNAPQSEPTRAEPSQAALDSPIATPSASPEATAAAELGSPETLIGEWRVAGIDGKSLDGPVGLTLSVDADTIGFEPRCAGFVWRYGYADGALEMARPAGAPLPPGSPPPPVCTVAVSAEQRALAAALDGVTAARKTASNGVELSGGGRSVVLYRQ